MDLENTVKNVTVALNKEDREKYARIRERGIKTIAIFRRGMEEIEKGLDIAVV